MTLSDEEIAEVRRPVPDYEAFLRRLRERGLSKLDSIKLLRQACDISLADAKRIAGSSGVWQDVREEAERLHDAVENAILDGRRDAE